MSSRTVRAALRDYMAPTPGLTQVFKEQPTLIDGSAWVDADGNAGTVAYVRIDHEAESMFVLTGDPATGRRVDYDVAVIVLYQYLIPLDEASSDNWVDGLDDLLDALKARVRADPSLGTGGAVVFQAGTEDGALNITRDLPKRDGGYVRSWNVLQFKAVEILTG